MIWWKIRCEHSITSAELFVILQALKYVKRQLVGSKHVWKKIPISQGLVTLLHICRLTPTLQSPGTDIATLSADITASSADIALLSADVAASNRECSSVFMLFY